MSPGDHVVFTYQSPSALRPVIGAWIAPALRRGQGALLICRAEHAAMAREEIASLGVDVAACEREGRLVLLDADDTLALFMRDGAPVGAVFKKLARATLQRIRRVTGEGTIRAWGEMVDILAHQGMSQAAHRLEGLWNEILAENDVQLLCSYDLDSLDPAVHAHALLDICSTHTSYVPENGDALRVAVPAALADVFGDHVGGQLVRILPTRSGLLDRMSAASAILVSLRSIHPALGERVAQRARERILDGSLNLSEPRPPRAFPPV